MRGMCIIMALVCAWVAAAGMAAACGAPSDPCRLGDRVYHVALPEGEGPFPVVLYLHGSFADGEGAVTSPALLRFVERGYALVAPTAGTLLYLGGREGTGWRYRDAGDAAFVRAVLDDALARFPLDGGRILAAGHSNGAVFLAYAACAGFDARIADYAALAGGLVLGDFGACPGHRPDFSLLETHGLVDRAIPLTGPMGLAPGTFAWERIDRYMAALTHRQGCAVPQAGRTGDFRLTLYEGCDGGHRFGLALHPGGHAFPEGWADLALDWFEGGD